ncbi:LacI family DNA-binding transcriptional regulator [Miltoncostaea marina]|uniref:LacI family DNA-binding transcriptional regulator n=1 Tax=Miltoncostaea marina TaxID=2843215 RepID=UPI001C3CE319|nr:LacI family DNA-binding transcriptional regulator [Miltoncostaea marina]
MTSPPGPRRAPARGGARRATLRDVAQAAGVSVWTVSTTYSNPARVASATRERVFAAAAALGFTGPDPVARSLALGRTRIVALVADGAAEPLLADPAAALVARGLARYCDRAGVSLLLAGSARGSAVDGSVLFRMRPPAAPTHPVVAVDVPPAPGVVAVRADVREAGAHVARHLRELGHRELVVLTWAGAGERLEGVRAGWAAAGPVRVFMAGSPEGATDAAAGPTRADAETVAQVALGREPRPTAVLALTDVLARGALVAARWAGLDVPRDLSVAGIDDLDGSDALGLTTAFVPYRPLGELAGATLSRLVEGEDAPPPPPLPTSLAIRSTTARAPAAG